jgi:hypothetical protein
MVDSIPTVGGSDTRRYLARARAQADVCFQSLTFLIALFIHLQETVAAVKVQAAFRRNKTLRDLERAGLSTAAIRNAQRRRKAQQERNTADIPSIFQCCGLGLAYGDDTEEDFEASRQHEKELYEERKKAREEREADLRYGYVKQQREKQTSVEEIIEVVD